MFLGHFGVALAAKPAARTTSLGTLFFASQFIDLLWPTLLLVGAESVRISPGDTRLTPLEFTHYPISHSLLAVAGWSVLFGATHFAVRRRRVEALVCGCLVASHWLLDLLTHRPDLPLGPGSSPRVGLGLWNHPALAVGLEAAIFVVGLLLYLRSTAASGRAGAAGLWCLVALLVSIYAASILGPPPPDARAVAWAGQAQWLLVAAGWWVDRSRTRKRGAEGGGALRAVKIVHTAVWAFFAGSICAIPVFSLAGRHAVAFALIGVVAVEVLVLVVNGMRCPLTDVAARYTSDRRENFDIYLPLWLARHNKTVFGALYLAGILVALVRWSMTGS